MVDARRVDGKVFQIVGPETAKLRSPGATRVNLVWSDKVFLSHISGSLGHAYHESGG